MSGALAPGSTITIAVTDPRTADPNINNNTRTLLLDPNFGTFNPFGPPGFTPFGTNPFVGGSSGGGQQQQQQQSVVTSAPATPAAAPAPLAAPAGRIPFTGTNSRSLAMLGALLVLVGALAAVSARWELSRLGVVRAGTSRARRPASRR
jgi:hypothetical protein